jgi:homoserine kinase
LASESAGTSNHLEPPKKPGRGVTAFPLTPVWQINPAAGRYVTRTGGIYPGGKPFVKRYVWALATAHFIQFQLVPAPVPKATGFDEISRQSMPPNPLKRHSIAPGSSLARVRAFAPGGIGNLGPGLDILGCAVTGPGDTVDAERTNVAGVRLADAGHPDLPRDAARHTATIAASEVLRSTGQAHIGIVVRVRKGLPLSGGQGGSAASAIAGAVAANAIVGFPLGTNELLRAALVAEERVAGRHLDNLAPALVGGIVLVKSLDPIAIHRFPVPESLRVVLVHPDMQLRTADARAVLPQTIDRATALHQAAAVATMVTAFATGNLSMLRGAIEDRIAEPARSALLPGFTRAKEAALSAGALGASIAGGGPSAFAMTDGDDIAEQVLAAMVDAYAADDISATGRVARIDDRGARLTLEDGSEMLAARA